MRHAIVAPGRLGYSHTKDGKVLVRSETLPVPDKLEGSMCISHVLSVEEAEAHLNSLQRAIIEARNATRVERGCAAGCELIRGHRGGCQIPA